MERWVIDRAKKQGKKSPHRFGWPSRDGEGEFQASEIGAHQRSLPFTASPDVIVPVGCSGNPEPLPSGERTNAALPDLQRLSVDRPAKSSVQSNGLIKPEKQSEG